MGKKIKDREFWESTLSKSKAFTHYYNRLLELSISMFEWKNLPHEIDERYLEMLLFSRGHAIFFKDDDLALNREIVTSNGVVNDKTNGFLTLGMLPSAHFDVYHIPTKRTAFASNGYLMENLDATNSVIIYNNMIRTPAQIDIEYFANRLAKLDNIIDINTNAQKTPVVILANENQRLTMLNLYKRYEGGEPFIFGGKDLKLSDIKSINTNAPLIAPNIYELKTQIWNEALTYLGISNTNLQKKERLLTDEVKRNQGGVIASRYSRLEARRKACKQINRLFGLNVWVDYREDYQVIGDYDSVQGFPNSDGLGGDIDE